MKREEASRSYRQMEVLDNIRMRLIDFVRSRHREVAGRGPQPKEHSGDPGGKGMTKFRKGTRLGTFDSHLPTSAMPAYWRVSLTLGEYSHALSETSPHSSSSVS